MSGGDILSPTHVDGVTGRLSESPAMFLVSVTCGLAGTSLFRSRLTRVTLIVYRVMGAKSTE